MFKYTTLATGSDKPGARKIMLVGDSWVSGRKLDHGIIDVLGEDTRVCALCLSGCTSGKILTSLRERTSLNDAMTQLGGPADDLIIVCGINDVIEHRGASRYAANVGSIAALTGGMAKRVFALQIPWFDPAYRPKSIVTRTRNYINKLVHDGGRDDVIPKYRTALQRQDNRPLLIDYDGFMPTFKPAELPDGVHLWPNTRPLGAHIARSLK